MNTYDLLKLDCRKYENKCLIQRALKSIKPFSKTDEREEIPIDKIERFLSLCFEKYDIYFRYITCSYDRKSYDVIGYYNCEVEINVEGKVKQMESIHASSIYELFCKIAIYVYSWIKKGSVKLNIPGCE